MGYKIKQLATIGGNTYAVIELDAAADISALPDYTDGSVAYIVDDPDKMYLKIAGAWALASKTRLAPGPHIDLDGVNPYMMMQMNLLFARRGEVAALLEPEKKMYYILDDLPTSEGDDFEGMIAYTKDDKKLQVCTVPGEQEVDTVTVTNGAETTSGDITITLNEEAVTVAVVEDDTAAEVAEKIKAAVEAAVTAETVAAWTVEIDGATLTFTKSVTGACAAPTAADTDETGCTFGTFAQTNEGVTAVWGALINV